jgi:hypothetical protein
MRPAIRRETLIALRATRTAHQIAREVVNPPINPAESDRHGSEWNMGVIAYARPLRRHAFSGSDWIWIGIASLLAIGMITGSTWLFSRSAE